MHKKKKENDSSDLSRNQKLVQVFSMDAETIESTTKRETSVSIITECTGRISISFANTICRESDVFFFVHLHQEASINTLHRTYHDSLPFWERTLNYRARPQFRKIFNPLNAELNPIYHLLALLGTHHILHISRVRVKENLHRVTSLCCKKSTTQHVYRVRTHLSAYHIFDIVVIWGTTTNHTHASQ